MRELQRQVERYGEENHTSSSNMDAASTDHDHHQQHNQQQQRRVVDASTLLGGRAMHHDTAAAPSDGCDVDGNIDTEGINNISTDADAEVLAQMAVLKSTYARTVTEQQKKGGPSETFAQFLQVSNAI